MNTKSINQLIWKLTIGLELLTATLAVPTVVLFTIVAGDFTFEQSLFVIGTATFALFTSYVWPTIRFYYLRKLLEQTIEDVFVTFSEEKQQSIKIQLLKFPRFNLIFYLIQWTIGIPVATFSLFLFVDYSLKFALPYCFMPLLIYPILGVSHYFLTEIQFAKILIQKHLANVELNPDSIPKLGIIPRVFLSMVSVFSLSTTTLGYLLIAKSNGFIQLNQATVTLVILSLFLILGIIVLSWLFAKNLKLTTENMVTTYHALSQGDLKNVVPLISIDELGHGSITLNSFIHKLRQIASNVIEEAKNLTGESKNLSQQTKGLVEKMAAQTTATEEISTGIEEVSASIRSTANTTNQQAQTTNDARQIVSELESILKEVHMLMGKTESETNAMEEATKSGRKALDLSLNAMQDIEKSVEHTASVVQIISEISDRVGLLSLNASIEAARAGDAGRGFAVVAGEISKLGEQTLDNTKQILSAVKRAFNATKSGRNAVSNTEETFLQIGSAIEKSIHLIKLTVEKTKEQVKISENVKEGFQRISNSALDISQNTSEQSQTSQALAKSISSIAQNTEYLHEFTNEIGNLSQKLSEKADILKKEVGFFQT